MQPVFQRDTQRDPMCETWEGSVGTPYVGSKWQSVDIITATVDGRIILLNTNVSDSNDSR